MKKLVLLFILLVLLLSIGVPCSAAGLDKADYQAEQLKIMGLLKDVPNTDFDLDRMPTRTEALVMFIRLLGKEDEVLAGSWSHPFTDVPSWADKYVGYSYEKSLMGILPNDVDTTNFLLADVVLVTYAALDAQLKGSTQTLGEKLNVPDISDYAGTYKMVKQVINGVEETNTEEMMYLHEDGTLALYTKPAEYSEYIWVYGTWSVKDSIVSFTTDVYDVTEGTLDDSFFILKDNKSWMGFYQKAVAKAALAGYVGAYKMVRQITNGVEDAGTGEILYVHEDGTLIYPIVEDSGYKWAYGTWSVKEGVVYTIDNLYGAAYGTLYGDTFIWKDNIGWVGYYQKVVAEADPDDYVGTYKMVKQEISGVEKASTEDMLYLHKDGTMAYTITEGSGYKWVYGTWSVIKKGVVYTIDSLYGAGYGTLDGDSFTLKDNKSWVGYYQKVVAKAALADYVGTYKMVRQITNGVEDAGIEEILYVHEDGTLIYPIAEESGYKWVYGTWSVKEGVVYTLESLYGAGYGTLNGDTFIWKENNWVGYYQKVVAEKPIVLPCLGQGKSPCKQRHGAVYYFNSNNFIYGIFGYCNVQQFASACMWHICFY